MPHAAGNPGHRGALSHDKRASSFPALAAPLRAAGVDRLNISLDTLRPDRFRDITRVGSLADVLRGLEAAESAGFQNLKLNCVLLGGVSDDEIADFAALTLTHPWQVRFIELMPMGTCVGWDRAHFLPSDAVLARCPQLREVGTQGVAASTACQTRAVRSA